MKTQTRQSLGILAGIALLFAGAAARGFIAQAQQNDIAAPREHVERSMTVHLAASPDKVFPLFGPVEESHWAPGWKPQMVYPPNGSPVAAGAVFAEGDEIWTMTVYDAVARSIHYVAVSPGVSVGEIDIHVVAEGTNASRAVVTFRHTALSARGDEEIRSWVKHFPDKAAHWEHAINHYLSSGQK